MITLPYTEETVTSQLYASRQISCQTGRTVNWIGDLELSPSSDTWYETELLPQLVLNQGGDYDAVMARERNNLGTVWNSWQTTWSGKVGSRTEYGYKSTAKRLVRIEDGEGGNRAVYTGGGYVRNKRTVNTVRTDKTRTGVTTRVSLRVDKHSAGTRTVNKAAIPYMRAKTLTFTGDNFKPNTKLYAFFNKTAVSSYVTPASSTYSSASSPVAGSPLFTDATGKVEGTFAIPSPKVGGNPKWQTGEVVFTLTSSSTNETISKNAGLGSAGFVTYSASGMLEQQQETIISTRNAVVSRSSQTQKTSVNSTQATKWKHYGAHPQPNINAGWDVDGHDGPW